MIDPSVEHEHDIMSKSGAGDVGGVFFAVFFWNLSECRPLDSGCSRDLGKVLVRIEIYV